MNNIQFSKIWAVIFSIYVVLGFSLDVYGLGRQEIIEQALDRMERKDKGGMREITDAESFSPFKRSVVMEKTLGNLEVVLGVGAGYIRGDTSYVINFIMDGFEGKSELVFPFDNWLQGLGVSLGWSPFYLNLEGWTELKRKNIWGMTNKDWLDGLLFSSTESEYKAKIKIFDANILYNFWRTDNPWGDIAKIFQEGKLGLLAGFKYESFKYDIFGVKDLFTDIIYYPGVNVLDYKVTYRIPYFGLNFKYLKNGKEKLSSSWELNFWVCGSPYVRVKDIDYHLLRNKYVYGRADGQAFLLGINTFLKNKYNWRFGLGFDCTDIRTKGKHGQYWYGDDPVTPGYDDTGDSTEGIDLKINSIQHIFWGLIQYKF